MYEFFHDEDDVGMAQLLPIEWQDYCVRECQAIAAHAEKYLAPNGVGWTEIYRRAEPPSTLPRLQMKESRFVELLKPRAKQFDRIVSTLGALEAELGIRRIGFGPGYPRPSPWANKGIIAELDGDEVGSLWGKLKTSEADERRRLTEILMALSLDQHLLLVDWRDLEIVDLRSPDAIDAYLRQ